MITVNLFTSSKHTQPLITTLKKAQHIQLLNIYRKLNRIEPADIFLVAEFGEIINDKILKMPKYGSLCLHPSLLPKYRGASPVQYAVMNAEKETGVTIFLMDKKVDHGPIISQIKEKIRKKDSAEALYQRLFAKGAKILIKLLPLWAKWKMKNEKWKKDNLKFKVFLPPKAQKHSQATTAPRLNRENGFIPLSILKVSLAGQPPPRQWPQWVKKFSNYLTIQPLNH